MIGSRTWGVNIGLRSFSSPKSPFLWVSVFQSWVRRIVARAWSLFIFHFLFLKWRLYDNLWRCFCSESNSGRVFSRSRALSITTIIIFESLSTPKLCWRGFNEIICHWRYMVFEILMKYSKDLWLYIFSVCGIYPVALPVSGAAPKPIISYFNKFIHFTPTMVLVSQPKKVDYKSPVPLIQVYSFINLKIMRSDRK